MWYTKVCTNNGTWILCHIQGVIYLVGAHYCEQACSEQARAYYTPKHFHLHSSFYLWVANYGGFWPCAIVVDVKHETFERLLLEVQQHSRTWLDNLLNSTRLASS